MRIAAVAALLGALILDGVPSRPIRSASNVGSSRVTFERGAETFWTGSGASPTGWQSFTDGSRAVGNQTIFTNLDSQDAVHLAVLDTLTLRSPADFSYRSEVGSNATAWLGIAFHVQDANNYYVLRIQTGGSTWELLKYAAGSPTTLGAGSLSYSGGGCFSASASAAVTVPTGSYLTLEVRRDPSAPTAIEVFYEGYRQASVADPSPYSGGKVGLYYRQSPPLFANPEVEGDIEVDVRVEVDPSTVIRAIDKRMFGTSIAMFGFQNGIDELFATESAYQTAIDKWFWYITTTIGGLGPTAIRYPGGVQGNDHYWSFGIGPATGRYSYDYSGYDSNVAVGVDEALRFAEELGATPNLIVNIDSMVTNWGESTAAQYAADWVEYTNSPDDGSNPNGGTDWAAVRTANGHKAPYGASVWELGNEINYFPQRPSYYANRVKVFSQAMKAVDPTILIGAMDDAFCYNWIGTNPLDWYTNGSNDGLLDVASAYFDFWVSHPYGPSNYWSMVYRGDACATVSKSFASTGTYAFTFQAAQASPPDSNGPHLRLDIDGIPAWSTAVTNGTLQDYSDYTAPNVPIAAGTHQVSACATGAAVNPLYVDTLVNVSGPGGASTVDFQNSKEFYEGLAGTPEAIYTYFDQRESVKGGKPTYITEWNTILGTHNAAFDLKTMLSNACFFESFLQYNMPYANFYPLYAEKQTIGTSGGQFVGQVEGVAYDDQNGEIGRADPRPRPSAFLIGLLREYFKGNLVQTRVSPHGYPFGPDTGFTDGGIAGTYTEIPTYVTAYSALTASGNMLAITAVNKDMENDHPAAFDLGSYTPYSTATMITLTGNSIGITNEPEDGATLNVAPTVQGNPAGNTFTYTLPKHSVTLILLPKNASDPFPPSAPTGFNAALNGSNVDLSWNAVVANDLAGYNVYRTRVTSGGPFGGKLNASPIAGTIYTDTTADRGATVRYAVKAVDTDGYESALSNTGSVTMPGGGPVTTVPTSATITQGSGSSPVSRFALADLQTYNVLHSSSVTDWYATFTTPQTPASVKALAVFYQGKQNAGTIASPMTGQMYLWNYTTSGWESATSTTFVANKMRSLHYGTTQAASLAKYISGSGEVKVRIRSSGASTFWTYCDYLALRTSD